MQLTSTLAIAATLGFAAAAPLSQAEDCTTTLCGVNGYDKDQGNLWYDSTGDYAGYTACYERCQDISGCESFAFGEDACILFNITLVDNITPVADSPYVFYDKACALESSIDKRGDKKKHKHKQNAASASSSASVASTTSAAATSVTTASATSTIAVPSGCTNVAPQVTITTFSWFNSTHNLDCANANYPSDAEVCWNADTNTLCDEGSEGCTCTPYCSTGLPSAAYQPLGYGPPDTITVGIDGAASTCSASNAQSIRNFEIGEGHFNCGSAADIMGFVGNSNCEASKTVSFYYNQVTNWCEAEGAAPRYAGSFEIECVYDAGKNATCTIAEPVVLNLSGWA